MAAFALFLAENEYFNNLLGFYQPQQFTKSNLLAVFLFYLNNLNNFNNY